MRCGQLQKNRKNNQPVMTLEKKQEKQSNCEARSTPEKTINLRCAVDSRAPVLSSKARSTWLHSETGMMMTTPDDSPEKQKKQSTCEVRSTLEKTEKTINL